MKINTTKLVVGVLAVAGVASLVGSISGTVAWFQYNTRAVAELSGTTAKCTEFLQVRAVNSTIDVKGFGDTNPDSGYAVNETFLNSTEKKIYTVTGTEPFALDTGKAISNNVIYKDSSNALHLFDGTQWKTPTSIYGEWKTTLLSADILTAAGRTDDGLSPVTMPFASGATAEEAAGTLYGQPVAGYERYTDDSSTTDVEYHWQEAEASDYMSFSLQFRVLNIDGTESGASPKLYAQDLFLTDLTIATKAVTDKEDISSAVRVHVSDGSANYLLAKGAGTANTITTTTKGALDLNLDGKVDNTLDVPGSHYSFDGSSVSDLEYGKDLPTQVAYDVAKADNGFYPTNDKAGHLTGGKALAVTNGTLPTDDADYTTLDFKIWLEGWQALSEKNSADTDTKAHPTIWDSAKYIGSKFNIGMSFGVTTLD